MLISKFSKNVAALSAVFFWLCSSPLFAQNNNRHDVPISDEHYEILQKRKKLIEKELYSVESEWSGVYQAGDHHPTIFMWSSAQGFLTWGSNHTFFPSRVNFGKAEFSNNRLFIKPEIGKEHLNYQHISPELVPIKWGEQHFLIGSDELLNFAFAVHSGSESQIVEYFVKSDDSIELRKGLPNLPKEYQKILKMKAITPKITAIKINDKEDPFDDEITLNLGRAHNLAKRTIFYYLKSSQIVMIMITDLEENSSKARYIGGGGSGEDDIKLKVGLKFTSKIPDKAYDF